MTRALTAITLLTCTAIGVRSGRAEDLLAAGNAAYHAGDYAGAIALYERGDSRRDFLTRRFNAAAAFLAQDAVDEALLRFEEVSATGEGELARRADYNIGYIHFQKAAAAAKTALEGDDPTDVPSIDARVQALVSAAESYRTALSFYRRATPQDDDTLHNMGVVKTALLAVVDEIARLEEMKKKLQEDELLRTPGDLLRVLAAREKLQRGLARALAGEGGQAVRLGSRRMRASAADNRQLAERLLFALRNPPEADLQHLGEEEREREKARLDGAAAFVARAIEAQKQSEIAYAARAPADAAPHHGAAATELRNARVFFPLALPDLVAEAIAVQEAALDATRDHAGDRDAQKGSTAGATLLGALKDRVLTPLARLVDPAHREALAALAEEEEDVVWAGTILSQAQIPATQDETMGPPSPGAAPAPPALSEEETRALTEAIQSDGKICAEEAEKAREALSNALAAVAIPPQEAALAALKRIAEALPRPPESLEEKLARLIDRQTQAAQSAREMADLDGAALGAAARALAGEQRTDGSVATGIAEELEKRQDEQAGKAIVKVVEGAEHIYASGESLDRTQPREAADSIDKAVAALKEALALLSGQQEQLDQQQQQQQQRQDQQQQQDDQDERDQQDYRLSPRLARLKKEEMDRKRREEEKKLIMSTSSITVDRDW